MKRLYYLLTSPIRPNGNGSFFVYTFSPCLLVQTLFLVSKYLGDDLKATAYANGKTEDSFP